VMDSASVSERHTGIRIPGERNRNDSVACDERVQLFVSETKETDVATYI
jgi:hypothetical protein